MRYAAALPISLVLAAAPQRADADASCRVVNVQVVPTAGLQMVAWLEQADGTYVDTIYITQQVGRYGLGNRPGRFDFNSGPLWPYGRRVTVFPVWSHRNGQSFPELLFQDGNDGDLSHASSESSKEGHYCQPSVQNDKNWDACDAGTSASQAFTDKGVFSATVTTGYPPRADIVRDMSVDSASVDMFKALDVFDLISQATPVGGATTQMVYSVPDSLPSGSYVLWVEVAKEQDFNATYSAATYPPPTGIAFGNYGVPYRGQPSIVYSVPFQVSSTGTTATGTDYVGYGDPNGVDGMVRPPDATITTDTPGSGTLRLQMIAGQTYRIAVTESSDPDTVPPAAPGSLSVTDVNAVNATLSFVEPGDDGTMGTATGYEVRYRANDAMTDDNFTDSMEAAATILPQGAGTLQTFMLTGLVAQTDYWVGVRAYDNCHNEGPISIVKLTTANRSAGSVDACFVATAAYGTAMANDVELLRRFRDVVLESSALGELGVEAYYTFGPALAGVVGESELLRQTARDMLAPVVGRVRKY